MKSLIDGYCRLVRRLSLIGAVLASAAVVLIMLLIIVEVVMRNFFGVSTQIADEYSGYLNMTILYLGLTYALDTKSFVRVDILYGNMSGPLKSIANWVILASSTLFSFICLFFMTKHVMYSYSSEVRSFNVSQTLLYIPQSLIVIGLVLVSLQLVAYALRGARDLP